MTKIYRTAEGGSPKAGGLVQVCGLAVDEHGAQAGMVLHLALFTIARRRQGDNAENARTDPFRDGFNCSAFAGRVTAFKYNNDFRPFSLDPILKSARPEACAGAFHIPCASSSWNSNCQQSC